VGASESSWKGRSGRVYTAIKGEPVREGRHSYARAVRAVGPPVGRSTVDDGARLALKAIRSPTAEVAKAFRDEVRVMVELTGAFRRPVCPRLMDHVDSDAGPAAVMEWCQDDLELWWASRCMRPDALRALCHMLETLCMGMADFHRAASDKQAFRDVQPDLRPRALMRTDVGHWVVSGFVHRMEDDKPTDVMHAATELMGSTENFSAPELIFGARKPVPAAVDTWSIGSVLFAMLRMRLLLLRGTELPSNGTESHHFRTHRAHLVRDLYLRKPRLFHGRELDARQFLYPDRLPDQDQRSLREALVGILGQGEENRENEVFKATSTLLNRALCITPADRFTDPLELARVLGGIAAMASPGVGEHAVTEIGQYPSPAAASQVSDEDTRVINYDEAPFIEPGDDPRAASPEPDPAVLETTVPEDTGSPFDRAGQTLLDSDAFAADTVREAALRESAPLPPTSSVEADPATSPEPRVADQERELARALARLKRLEARVELMRRDLAEAEPTKASSKGGLGAAFIALIALGVGTLALGATAWHWVAGYTTATAVVAAPELIEPELAEPPADAQEPSDLTGDTSAAATAAIDEGAADPEPEATPSTPGAADAATGAADAASTPKSSGSSAASSSGSRPKTPKAVVSPASDDLVDPAVRGRVGIVGAKGYLVGESGRVELGAVDPGVYEVFTKDGDAAAVSLGTVSVAAGDQIEFRCGFGTCKRTR